MPRTRLSRVHNPKRDAYVARREALRPRFAELWKAGVPAREIAKELGLEKENQVASYVSYYRSRFPEDFPFRLKFNRPASKEPEGGEKKDDRLTVRLSRWIEAAKKRKAEAEGAK